MTTRISTKIGAFAAALMMNALILASVAFLFNSQAQASIEQASTTTSKACSTLAVV